MKQLHLLNFATLITFAAADFVLPIQLNSNTLNNQISAVPIKNESKSTLLEFFALINIGTPGQPLKLQFETGSYRLWINSMEGMENQFKPQFSSTFNNTNILASMLDVNNAITINGTIAEDKFNLVNSSLNLSDSSIQFIHATTVNLSVSNNFNGLIGLGFTPSDLWNNGTKTFARSFMDQLIEKKVLSNPTVSYFVDFTDVNGEVNFGNMDSTKYSGPITWIPHQSITLSPAAVMPNLPTKVEYLWSVGLRKLNLGKTEINFNTNINVNASAIFATGESVSYFPKELAQNLSLEINSTFNINSNRYEIECSKLSQLPNLTFTFFTDDASVKNEATFELTPYEYALSFDEKQILCFIGIFDNSDTQFQDTILLGNLFLR
ncbi:Vacuolar protease A [Clydaea vesicula]|uniref:Vacuolar protease A n=1 Tax=Clydaea vesicula TaxID=447962 RepID=A0AAD5XST9_9FUNG|nr:Vacuolar protease A [Clydaea vesicula]